MNNRTKPPKSIREKNEGTGRGARGFRLTVETVAFAVLAVYLAGYLLSMLNKPRIAVETVAYGQIDVPTQYSGVIMRDETACYAEESGALYFSYAENEYVKKGSVVCVIKSGEDASSYEREIESINDSLLDRNALYENPARSEEINRLNAKMRSEINRAIPLFMSGQTREVYKFKNALQSDIDTRNEVLLSDSGSALSALFDRKSAFESRLGDATSSYAASTGGIVSYGVDGLESALSPENMMNVSREQTEDPPEITGTAGRQVEAGSPLFKIVNSNTWYLCTYLENELALDWDMGMSKFIYFNEGGSGKILMKITAIERKDDKTYVVFSSSKYLPDFINSRHVKFSLEEETYRGLKVPNMAITEKTALLIPSDYIYEWYGSYGVYVKDGSGLAFKRVNVLSMGKEESWVLQNFDSVKLGDTVYKSEDKRTTVGEEYKIENIKTAPGLYVANSGTAEFKQVSVLKRNEFYSVVERGAGVKSYDTIISDANAVNDNQIIR